ncbi:hypothetical protein V6N12_010628 [Hibiscus sabdariffa]|uniref:Uncharacterized protein n=1 Tax=Hibiscus sabdariffa TaxID=183260 RepID=A0ABR2EKP3_9ROSI
MPRQLDVSLPTMPDDVATPVPLDNLPCRSDSLIATPVPLTDPPQQDVSPDLPQQDVSPNLPQHHPLPQRVRQPNPSATYFCKNLVFHSRMKHLAFDYFFVRDLVAARSLFVQHIPSKAQIAASKAQIADTLTKPFGHCRSRTLLVLKLNMLTLLWACGPAELP